MRNERYTKTKILQKFKQMSNIKRHNLNFKSNDDIKKDFIEFIKNTYINKNTNKPISEEEINKHFLEDAKSFNFLNHSVFKNVVNKPISRLNKIPSDIKTTNIKDYDRIKGSWFMTDIAKYSEVFL